MTSDLQRTVFVARDGVRLVADRGGSADAPAVILLHGGGQTRHSWSRAVERLLAEGFQVINYDARGHGESDWSPEGAYQLTDRADDLATITASLDVPFLLVGASLVLAGCGGTYGAPDPVTEQGKSTLTVWRVFLFGAVAVAALIWVLVLWSVIRYRRRPGPTGNPPQRQYNIPMELGYTILPILAVIGLFYAVGYWNSFFTALLYLNDTKKWPLQLILRTYVVTGDPIGNEISSTSSALLPTQQSLQMAILVISLVPILVLYPFIRRHFGSGLMLGAVKG